MTAKGRWRGASDPRGHDPRDRGAAARSRCATPRWSPSAAVVYAFGGEETSSTQHRRGPAVRLRHRPDLHSRSSPRHPRHDRRWCSQTICNSWAVASTVGPATRSCASNLAPGTDEAGGQATVPGAECGRRGRRRGRLSGRWPEPGGNSQLSSVVVLDLASAAAGADDQVRRDAEQEAAGEQAEAELAVVVAAHGGPELGDQRGRRPPASA